MKNKPIDPKNYIGKLIKIIKPVHHPYNINLKNNIIIIIDCRIGPVSNDLIFKGFNLTRNTFFEFYPNKFVIISK